MNELAGQILTPEGWVTGRLQHDARIQGLRADASAPVRRYILPGFIDLHVHGAAGVDIMQGGSAAVTVARAHARHGTTAMLGTTMTAHEPEILRALRGLAPAIAERAPDGARLLGVHLEGPFLSHKRLGAQPPLVLQATLAKVQQFHALAPIKVLTLAPEIEGHLALIPQLAAMDIRVQLGHSAGSYEDGVAALKAGAAGFTHLFNGMTGLNHYEPGIVGAAMAHAEYAELIPDLQHVHPGALRAALRAIPKLYCITDATAATGMPDGEYALGPQRVYKCLGCVRLAGGSLAGSALTMDQALRNLVELGLDLADASRRLSQFPADYLGLAERGRLRPGAWADLVVLDEALRLQQVFVEGQAIPLDPLPLS
ncbi:N-acetylglucosamine-6-phosphate deacetylase [Roseateles sp. DAIF2]|uniref:N-acetylglucosamine-6-phosphate deacetylase n=1 Tax=Roseateles sp. DAIF2 TaxID=2714952 RepID=UPI0018A2763B|nr:N-acetylglucosamine-6-phosphate deacetylase [Roseateles sp. DAIF2]QPF71493.1 N-acetylglucosamine-6-phosphate deacetylase [Roseateles sp. DAIF2]